MSKTFHTIIGNVFLGTLIWLSLIIFILIPNLAAAAPQSLEGEIALRYRDKTSLSDEGKLDEYSTPIVAQGADFVVNYNPVGDCTTSGLPNFLPTGPITAWPQAAKDAFEHALSIWAMLLDANQMIVINACWVDPGGANPLGTGQPVSAFANFTGAISNTMYPVALANELAGTDLNDNDGFNHDGIPGDADAEIIIAFNSTTNWYFGTDANPAAGQKDFVTVALHEIAHGLGFASTMDVDTGLGECGTHNAGDGCWSIASALQGMPVIYDRFVVDSSGGSAQNLINTDVFSNPSSELGNELTDKFVYFDGPNAKLATGDGNPPRLYAPTTFDPGSSILHLDNGTYNKQSNPNRLMTPISGTPIHHPGPITLGILEDIGWNIIDLPPVTFAKTTSVNAAQAGQALTYTLTVTNTGYLTMTDVTITDTVPANTTLDTDSLSLDALPSGTTPGSLITWSTERSLATGHALSRTFAVTVSLGSGVSTITNTAFVTSSAGVGANDTVSATVISSNNNSNVYLPIILSN